MHGTLAILFGQDIIFSPIPSKTEDFPYTLTLVEFQTPSAQSMSSGLPLQVRLPMDVTPSLGELAQLPKV